MKKTILSYWIGEFGWELMAWQAHLRKLSNDYDIKIICRPSSEFFYQDFATEIIPFTPKGGEADGHNYHNLSNNKELEKLIKKHEGFLLYKPYNIGVRPLAYRVEVDSDFYEKQEFIKFESDVITKEYDFIIHARNRTLDERRNWSKDKWDQFIDFMISMNMKVACIGAEGQAMHFDQIDNYVGCDTETTVALMNRALMVVGQSSGAMHLASLCGSGHYVWSEVKNKSRYETVWNPLNSTCLFEEREGWNPEVDTVINGLKIFWK